jgi:hypothetical protein
VAYISKTCIHCGKVFQIKNSDIKYGRGKYCSRSCKTAHKSLLVTCSNCKKEFSVYLSRFKSSKKYIYCSIKCRANHLKIIGTKPPSMLGKKRPEHSIRMSGENSPFWKGGTYDKNRKIDEGRKFYRDWRKQVFEKDKYQCLFCGNKNNLEADHILPYSRFPEKKYDLDNGRTLCHSCHKATETYGKKSVKI